MNRKAFIASLPFLPSAVKAVLAPKRSDVIDGARTVVDCHKFTFDPLAYVGEIQWVTIDGRKWELDRHPLRYSLNGQT